jgi:hypothetical protein
MVSSAASVQTTFLQRQRAPILTLREVRWYLLLRLLQEFQDRHGILVQHPGLGYLAVSHLEHPHLRNIELSSTLWRQGGISPKDHHIILRGFQEDRRTFPNSFFDEFPWLQRLSGPVETIHMFKGTFMAVIVSTIGQAGRFVNHDLGMVCLQEASLVASPDGFKQTLHGFHLLL